MNCLSAKQFAAITGTAERTLRNAFSLCASGKLWRGHKLPVVQMSGRRGGTGGIVWGLDLSRASSALLDEFPALQDHLTETATPTQKSGKGEIDQWHVQVQLKRFEMIQSAIGTVPRSRERAKALRAIAAGAKPCWGSSEPPTVKTLRLWLQAYDERGLIGLMPKAPVTKGKTRVLLSQTWDQGIDLTEDRRVKVATQLDSYTRSLIAKSMSARKARSLAAKKLVELE